MPDSAPEEFTPTDPVLIDAMVLAAETSSFLDPVSLEEMGDTDEEFWAKMAELVPEANDRHPPSQ